MKQTLCVLLSLMLALTGFAGLCVPAAAADWQTGDVVTLGSYPQSRVTDDATIAALNAVVKTWVSYGCYSGTGGISDGRMSAKDYMQYCDVTVDGQKYRGVQFTQYRPKITGYGVSADNSYQDDNGYTANAVYWFRYEPLNWRVLDPTTGLVLCETVIDSQPTNNYVLKSGTDDYGKTAYWGDADQSRYANNYAQSDLRQWLNHDFLNAAFSPQEQVFLTYATLDNSADENVSSPAYGSSVTADRVFLLSYADAQNAAYGFTDNESRRAKSSGYAKCQGVSVSSNYSPWLLRSPGNNSRNVISVNDEGDFKNSRNPHKNQCGSLACNPPQAACNQSVRTECKKHSNFDRTTIRPLNYEQEFLLFNNNYLTYMYFKGLIYTY